MAVNKGVAGLLQSGSFAEESKPASKKNQKQQKKTNTVEKVYCLHCNGPSLLQSKCMEFHCVSYFEEVCKLHHDCVDKNNGRCIC